MEKERRTKSLVIVVLLIVVAGLTVAFASLSSVLNIKGTAYLDAAKWGIKFKNLSEPVSVGTATTKGTATIEETKSAEITGINVSLSNPGDKVVYTVDLVNEGTINAKIDNIEKTVLTEEQQRYLTFKVMDKDYNEIKEGDILQKGETKKIIIVVEFIKDLSKEDLPTNASMISLSYKLNFVQTDDNKTTIDSSENFNNIVSQAIKTVTNNSNGSYKVYNLPNDSNKIGVSNSLNGRIVINEDKETQIALYDENKTYCALKKYYDKNFDVVSYSDKCIPESADNLVKNGYGEYGDNTNFSNLSYDKENGYFYTETDEYIKIYSKETIKIDANKTYYQSVEASGYNSNLEYAGIFEYDIDLKRIDQFFYSYEPNTLTYLTEDLKNGDTKVYINDVSNFGSNSKSGFIFWNYKDSTGYTYPEETYSRNTYLNLYTSDNINKNDNTITLTNPWSYGTIKKGTKLSEQYNYGSYNYTVFSGIKFDSNMTFYEKNSITGYKNHNLPHNKFSYGTKYVNFLLLHNYNKLKNSQAYYRNFVIKEVR